MSLWPLCAPGILRAFHLLSRPLSVCLSLSIPTPIPKQQIDYLGRRIARKLNLNYFDYEDISTRHVIRHQPPENKKEEDEELDWTEDQNV